MSFFKKTMALLDQLQGASRRGGQQIARISLKLTYL